ncbi:TPA: DNA polymerase [Stenotrophomonas maltophilia]|uniref:DNA polymerase n=1 Tax=Stenotrophomonas TaxID=40323 RepID=UPI0013D9068A|nr:MULTISPECIES: DNA polymerase [Stenotrophomonas]MBH1671699.1 ribonuclease H-like domain-containing protein [Stenotrophomonas maltophilia]MCF3466218.1 DNA polymerase [Stenotrophomonas maltophilia]MCF3510738.1 DNA polymerase [Stenotrophomonas maltophilia]MCF3536265.1 DNA polymerase [Stenotrophomonas maltophilia]MCU1152621.1 ribonuclease H-like domain-containing protein [Stenotrophomonas maltophilia]
MILVFDCETNGLLDELDTIHCISLQEVDETGAPRGPILSANDHGTGEMTVRQAVERLKKAKRVVGHNIAGFDIPAIAKVFPDFKVQAYFDTLLMSTLVYPDLKDRDFKARKKQGANPVLPGKLIGRHALEAWGYRLGRWKGDYAAQMAARGLDPWAQWSQEMDDYCDQDVAVTQALFALLMSKGLPTEAIELEQAVAPILSRQQRYGYLFDQEKARELECILVSRRTALEAELRKVIPPWKVVKRKFVPKRDDKRRGYVKGVEVTTYKDVVFNPASRQHIADRLTAMYGWQPQEFTEKGQPKIDEEVLGALKFPIIPLLLEHFIVNKRLGQLAEGDEAWLKAIKKDGRIHGSVNQNAAVTGRMTHSKPNIAQVPKCGVPYGKECRSLFCVPTGKLQVGADASGLELRCLAHFMAKHDGGEYAKVILEGDIHSVNQSAAGLPTRDNAKTFIYAFLYGAGDAKLGSIVGKGRQAGAKLRSKFLAGLPALEKLVRGVKKRAAEKGYLIGLDGRKLHIRSDHAALNTLLQSAGALVMKKALVILDADLQAAGLVPGVHYEFLANVHDEWQIEVDEDKAEFVGKTAQAAIRKAGDHFGFRCPLDGEFKIGRNWAETH